MPLFSRRHQPSTPANPVPTTTANPMPPSALVYDVWRARFSEAPSLQVAPWVGFGLPADVVAGGAATGLLDAYRVDVAETGAAGVPYATVVTEDGRFWGVVECHDAGRGLAYTVLRHHDGSTSRHGPGPMPASSAAWGGLTLDIVSALLARHALAAAGVPIADERLRSHSFGPFRDFAERGPVPKIESWNIVESISTGAGPRVEIWADTVDVRVGSAMPYRTPMVAAAFGPTGDVVAMVSVETMPDVHDNVFAVIFDGQSRLNLGSRPELLDPQAFRTFAVQTLGQLAR